MNLLIIVSILFAALWLVVNLTEAKAKPLTSEQSARLSKWLLLAVCVLLAVQFFNML